MQQLPIEESQLVAAISAGSNVSASTEWGADHGPTHCRLHYTSNGGGASAWCSRNVEQGQWLQVSLPHPVQWVRVETQGRGDHDQWVKAYMIHYSNNGRDWFVADNGKLFPGNKDRHTVVTHDFLNPFTARCVRIVPTDWHDHISLRCEVYYCDPLVAIASETKSNPDGSKV